jgi:hypothetical protein
MTYQSQAALSADREFADRLGAALTTEARALTDDPVGRVVMSYPAQGVQWFLPFVSSAPGFADRYTGGGQSAITDGDLLSSVQASWADVAAVHGLDTAP